MYPERTKVLTKGTGNDNLLLVVSTELADRDVTEFLSPQERTDYTAVVITLSSERADEDHCMYRNFSPEKSLAEVREIVQGMGPVRNIIKTHAAEAVLDPLPQRSF